MIGFDSNDRVYVDRSAIHGLGLFAARPLAEGQLVGVYRGAKTEKDGRHVLWLENEGGDGWTGVEGRNEMRFLNHADQPNAEMVGLSCYAVQFIAPDEEITIDYGWNDS